MKWLHLSFFLILMILISLGQLQRLAIGPFTAIYLHDLVLSCWSLYLLSESWPRVRKTSKEFFNILTKTPARASLVAIILTSWGLATVTGNLNGWSLLFIARLFVYLCWGWLIYTHKVISKEWWQLGYLASGTLIAVFGILQYLTLPDVRFLRILGWDDHYFRLVSTQLDPNFAGLILTVTLFWWWKTPFSWWQWLIHGLTIKDLKHVQQLVTFLISLLLLVCIGLTFSRASWLSLLLGLSMLIKQKLKIKTAFVAISLLILTIILAPKPTGEGVNLFRTSSIFARTESIEYWITSLQPYQLLIGRGLFIPPANELMVVPGITADHANLPDNLIILLFSGTGAVGLAICIFILITEQYFTQLKPLTTSVIAAILAHSMFNNSWFQVFVLLFLLGTLIRDDIVTT